MAVLFFDGFDMGSMAYSSSIVPSGNWDHQGNPKWQHGSHGATRKMYYREGFSEGRSFEWGSNVNAMNTSFTQNSAVRAHFYLKPASGLATPSGTRGLIWFVHGTSISNTGIGIRVIGVSGGAPVAELATFAGGTDYNGTAIADTQFTMNDGWSAYELYVDHTTGDIEVKENGSVKASATGATTSSTDFGKVVLNAPDKNPFIWDHFIVTDGNSLHGTSGYHAAAVVYNGFGKDCGSSTGIRGRIRIDGSDYFATPRTMTLATVDKYSARASNVWHDYWLTNPNTSAAWDTLPIEAFGICRTDNNGGHLIVSNVYLSFIEMNTDGRPLVRYQSPGNDLLVDETVFVRTHSTKDWNEHVDNYPRTMPPFDYSEMDGSSGISADGANPFDPADLNGNDFDDVWYEDYLGITGPGCILWEFSEPEEPTIYGGTGLTFAEEFRDTYKDWENIVSSGDDFCSYFITGYKVHGEGNKKFQSNYVTLNYETHALGSAYIQGVWDYALANTEGDPHSRSDTGRWGSTQQVYGPTNSTDYKHAFRKLKIRGHGLAMQMKVKCESGKPFFINGWTIYVTGNSTT